MVIVNLFKYEIFKNQKRYEVNVGHLSKKNSNSQKQSTHWHGRAGKWKKDSQ